MSKINIDKEILRIALPAVVANITIPILGLIDLAIAGHLGNSAFIGAMSVGAMMFNLTYWNFGFLRMGTSGITAQAYGRGNAAAMRNSLLRAVALAMLIALCILLLQYPIQWLALYIISPSASVEALARQYFLVVIWGAPAVLVMMSLKGWFLGMQDSQSAMRISLCVDLLNVLASLVAVYVLKMGFVGIGVGTLVAEYVGLAYGCWLVVHKHRSLLAGAILGDMLRLAEVRRMMAVNGHIFFRSMCLIVVTLSFVSIGARSGDMILAANAIIMQLYILFSYTMDGVAFAGEALVGRFVGERDNRERRRCVKHLMMWGVALMMVYVAAYGIFPQQIFSALTDDASVVAVAFDYRWWCMAIPVASMAAFVWDGVFIGQTDTQGMLYTVAVACATYFCIYFLLPIPAGNNRLWLAFIVFLLMRSVVQTAIWFVREKKYAAHSSQLKRNV